MAKPPTLNAALSALQQHLTARTPLAPDALAVLRERLGNRRVITLDSADLLAQRGAQVETYQETYRGAKHIPVLVRACAYSSAFPGRHVIPDRPINQFSDREAAWLTVCQAVVRTLS